MADSTGGARPTFLEFFCGGGMARAGLGEGWRCLFANDIDPAKAESYRANWGDDHLRVSDIATLSTDDLPGRPDLVWASSPCQDLSLAGARAGLGGQRSGAFHEVMRLVRGLRAEGRAPRLVVMENVCGTLTSRDGGDFATICRTYLEAGYRPGALILNADGYLPQSRPRLFVVGARMDLQIGAHLLSPGDEAGPLDAAIRRLPDDLRRHVVRWAPPARSRPASLADLLEPDGSVRWRSAEQTARLLDQMSPLHRARVAEARAKGVRMVGAVFRRTRIEVGAKVQRAEIRFDRAGCLRTPAGGSSRQIVVVVDGRGVRSRLLTGREMARLMGLPDSYRLPGSATETARLCGDGVAVPVVRSLADALLEPLLLAPGTKRAA